MLRRLAVVTSLLGIIVLMVGRVPPAPACHVMGPGCPPPDQAPFNPQFSGSLVDNRTNSPSEFTETVTQQDHEQYPRVVDIDFPAGWQVNLDLPANGERLADLTLVARTGVAPARTDVTLNGRIEDHNDHATPTHPSGGVYHWLITIELSTGDIHLDAFADKNAPDGHLHIHFDVTDELLDSAKAVDGSLLRLDIKSLPNVAGGTWLRNPATGGTYTFKARIVSEFGVVRTPTADVTIAERVPTTVTISPTSQTKRLGENASTTVNVKDQKGEAIVGAKVTWDVQSGPHAGTKCSNVSTDGAGNASCAYTETQTGSTDTLRATATNGGQSKSVTGTVKWLAPTTVTLTPASSTKRVGESLTLTATVKDQDGAAMSGISVTFTRTGANPGSETKTTDAGGQATHTYSGTGAGDDSISATATLAQRSASASASATWYVPAASSLSVSPANATKTVGSTHTVTATVNDQQGRALAGVTVHFEVTGANSASGDKTTDASGQAAFSYTGNNAGQDTVTATVPGTQLSATANVTWSTQQQCAQDDFDCDGLRNTQDNCWNVANPDQKDNDRDGFGDACDSDDDNDSLQDSDEAPNGCNAFLKDTDGDGLNDWQEVKGYKTKCNNPDSDGDTLTDYQEVTQTGSDPNKADTDGDGVRDDQDPCPRTQGTSCISIKIP